MKTSASFSILATILLSLTARVTIADVEFESDTFEVGDYTYKEIYIDLDDSHDICIVSVEGDEFVIKVAQFDQEDFPGLGLWELQYALENLGFEAMADMASDVETRSYDLDYEVGTRFHINGYAGSDIIAMTNNPTPAIINGGPGSDLITGTTYPGATPRWTQIFGGEGNDKLYAMGASSVIHGGPGWDTIHGSDFRDELWGEEGNDTLIGNGGDDVMGGGIGNDVMEGNAGSDTMAGGSGNDVMDGGSESDTMHGNGGGPAHFYGLTDHDEMTGGSGDDLMYGDDGDDWIHGGSGNDIIDGGDGSDELHGGDDDDELYGGLYNDSLFGGNGIDYLDGGEHHDDLNGGYDGEEDSLVGGPGHDNFHFRWYTLGKVKQLSKSTDPRLVNGSREGITATQWQTVQVQLTVEMDEVQDFGSGDEYFSELVD